jgi:DNA-binding NarL/FixJ family response regulator
MLDLLEAGAHDYVLRQASFSELIRTISGVYRGQPPCSPRVAASVCARIVELAGERRRRRILRDVRLTPREEEILGLVAEGLRNKEIATRLRITLATVKNHVHNLLEKLQANGRREAIRRAYENGLLENPLPAPRALGPRG